jgi:hypothetical protein
VSRKTISEGSRKGRNARAIILRAFQLDPDVCAACSLRAGPKKGRLMVAHP